MSARGALRRSQILEAAVSLSSAEGLGGLSIGRLAAALQMSKSGLIAHFGTKQALQLAVVERAAERFEREVIEPARRAPAGLARLRRMLDAWIDSIDQTENAGGCFFDAASSEFASQPGAVRDRLATLSLGWLDQLEAQARVAQERGELGDDVDPALLAFQLHAYVEEANWAKQLFDRPASFQHARAAVAQTLHHAARSLHA